MYTTPNTPTLADLQRTMIRVQIAALETLERCMADPESTGNEKTDKAKATERNRQRMAAAQALIHCRTMARELREAEAQTHRIAEENRQAGKKAIYERARLRRLHRQYPGEYEDPDAPAPTPVPAPSLLAGEGGIQPQVGCRMRGRSEPPNHLTAPSGGDAADPSPQPSPAGGEGAKRTRSKTRKPKHPRQSRKRKHR